MAKPEWRRPRTSTLALLGIIGPIWFTTFGVLQGGFFFLIRLWCGLGTRWLTITTSVDGGRGEIYGSRALTPRSNRRGG